jgi:7-carboxy-7-deazaguanine synthase (Cx14CxxC type)
MSVYLVKEIYYTLQGEGAQTGRPAVFCRFAGCNLWSGREEDRSSAVCQFCDTDFRGVDGPNGGRYTANELALQVARLWPAPGAGTPYVVCTGGEPLLQLDEPLIEAFHQLGFEVAVETNGTRHAPAGLDWICMSPKAGSQWVLSQGHELKLVFPQPGAEPERFAHFQFEHFYLQPMDGPHRERNTQLCIEYCLQHPQWRLSLQSHKLIGIP